MPRFQILSRAQLVGEAHDTLAFARHHDPRGVEASTLRLFDDFTEHVLAERGSAADLSPAAIHTLRQSQEHAADLLLALAASAARGDDQCSCEEIAENVVVELTGAIGP